MASSFDYFRENMESLGLPAPKELYANLTTATGTASTLAALVEKFGPRVTVRELILAGTKLERLSTAGALYASYYVGAVIGSIVVAAGRSAAGGTSLADVLVFANASGLGRPWVAQTLTANPKIYKSPPPTPASSPASAAARP